MEPYYYSFLPLPIPHSSFILLTHYVVREEWEGVSPSLWMEGEEERVILLAK